MEGLGQSIADGIDMFTLLNLVSALRVLFIEAYNGDIQLTDAAYMEMQRIIGDEINPSLNGLKAGAPGGLLPLMAQNN